jgi:LytR cell envelope-related transcriptional attenuator
LAVIFAALSVQDFIDKIGAYVGFAAAIGVALFALLLFSQARELKRLREWGAQTHDRIGELERRLAAALELARRASSSQRTMAPGTGPAAVAQRPAPRPAAVARTSSPTRLPLLPAAPVRVAGAALGSATMVVPLPKHPPGAAPAAAPAPTSVLPVAPATPATPPASPPAIRAIAAAAAPVASTPAPATAAAQGPVQPAPPAPAPSTPPAGTNGHSDTFPPVPPIRRAPATGRRVPPRGAARPAAGARVRPRVGAPPAAPLRTRSAPSATPGGAATGGDGRADAPHGHRRAILLLGGLALVAVAVIAVLALSGGGKDSPSEAPVTAGGTPAQTTGATGSSTPGAAPAHDRITVAVLNGTTTVGLASTVAGTLTADGFVQGPVTNASDQGRSVTVVSYFDGREREAREVAQTLNVPADAVQPIDADTEAACAAQDGSCTATVVVTVGADRQ